MQTHSEVESKRQDQPASITTVKTDHENLECTVHPKLVDDCIRAGQEAWKRLSSGHAWNDWLLVGEAVLAGRVEAMRTAHTNKPEGRRYNEEFSDWLRAKGFDAIEATTRKRLLKCLEYRNEIQAWRATLTTNKLHELNHPGVVLRRWQKTIVKKFDGGTPKKPSHTEKLKASIITLEEENSRMKREIERGGGDLWAPDDKAKDIARVIFEKITLSKARELARELGRLARSAKKESQETPKPKAGGLVWKDKGNNYCLDPDHKYSAFSASGTVGEYDVTPATAVLLGGGGMKFAGYAVSHFNPNAPKGEKSRTLARNIKSAEKAKAIAQADHDRGGDQ